MNASRIFALFGLRVAGKAKHVHVVMPAHQIGVFFIKGLSRARAGNFVRGNVNPDTAGVNEQAEFRFARGDGLRDGLREIGIIVRRVSHRRAKILDAQTARQQIFFQRFLQFKAAVIRADGEIDSSCNFRAVRRGQISRCSINFKSDAMPCSICSRQCA